MELDVQLPEAKQILDKMKTEVGVSFKSSDQHFLICGSLSQINKCHVLVQKYLTQDENISDELSKFSLESKDVTAEKERVTNASPTGSKSLNVENNGIIIAKPVHENPEGKDLHIGNQETKEATRISHTLIAEIQTFKTSSLAISFMKQFYNKQIQEVTKECLVTLDTMNVETQGTVTVQPEQDCDPTSYNNACSKFAMFLDSASQGMASWELDLKGTDQEEEFSLIRYLSSKYPVILEQPQENGPFVVYGDSASVDQVKRMVQGRMSGQAIGGDDSFWDQQRMAMVGGTGSVSIETYSYCTENGINISLRYGDITNENVDAIVNPANEFLVHGAGLARIIVGTGGREIQIESDKLMIEKRRGKRLNLGEAVHTKAGNLPCKFIIHAVGPEWGKQSEKKTISLLQKACVESLKLAAKLGLSSIALPAISSGVFRAPIDVCAFAMLNGVEEYMEELKKPDVSKEEGLKKKVVKKVTSQKKKDEKKSEKKKESPSKESSAQGTGSGKDQASAGLRDIRFVLIDADAMDVFEREFVRRFSNDPNNTSSDDDSV